MAAGRLLGGVAYSILYTSFESWLIAEADAVGAAKLDAKLRQMAASISSEAEEAASAVREELNQKAAALAREVKKVQEAMRDLGKAIARCTTSELYFARPCRSMAKPCATAAAACPVHCPR